MAHREGLTPEENRRFEEWARYQRETNLKAMADSAMVMSLYPKSGEIDVDYCLQTGAAVLLDKPLLVLVDREAEVPPKLRAIADEILEVDSDEVDTSSPELAKKIVGFMERHGLRE